jgi:hypothetical protein
LFYFYQCLLYPKPRNSFPDLKGRCGRFVGIEENVGDAKTFLVLTDDTHMVIARCDVRPADNPLYRNQRADVRPVPDALADGESESKIVMPTDGKVPVFTPSNIIGLTYLRERDVDGSVHRAKIVEEVSDNIRIDENGEPVHDGVDSIVCQWVMVLLRIF